MHVKVWQNKYQQDKIFRRTRLSTGAKFVHVYLEIVVVRIFNATRHPRHIEAAAIVMYMHLHIWCRYSFAHLVPLSATKRRPVHFILNPGHVEYELGILIV